MMPYENIFYPQNPLLKKYVHSFWILRSESSGTPYLLPPDPYFNVILSFQSNTNVCQNDTARTRVAGSFIVGMRTSRVFLQPDGAVDYLSIEFYPHALRCFLDFPCASLTDSFVEMSLLKNKLHEALKPVMNQDLPDQKRVALIERGLLRLLARADYFPGDYLIAALHLIRQNNGAVRVRDICDDLGTPARRLNREFERFVGVSPKFYARIVRFNTVLEKINGQGTFKDYTELAYQCGYSDQAHLIHECSDFTGLSPKELYAQVYDANK